MGLFFEVLSAINNPHQQASIDQLGSITNTVQNLASSRGVNPATMQNVMSSLGGMLRPVLQQQRAVAGGQQLENLVNQFSGESSGLGRLSSFLTPQLQQQMVQGIAQQTGVSGNTLQAMLPTLLPTVVNFFKMGASTQGGKASNPILNAFLDGDGDGNVDLGDAFKFATRFMNPPRF